MLLQILFEFGDVLLEESDGLQLMASQEYVAAERELPATFRSLASWMRSSLIAFHRGFLAGCGPYLRWPVRR